MALRHRDGESFVFVACECPVEPNTGAGREGHSLWGLLPLAEEPGAAVVRKHRHRLK